jgi:hypothetical protein
MVAADMIEDGKEKEKEILALGWNGKQDPNSHQQVF